MEITELKQRLNDRAQEVCDLLLPGGRSVKDEYQSGSTAGEEGKSLKVCLKGNKKGIWSDFATGESGDLIDLWVAAKGQSLQEALTDIRSYLGVEEPQYTRPKKESFAAPEKPKCRVPEGQVLEYLTGRSVSQEAIKAYKVAESGSQIVFPFIWQGDVALIKVRDAVDGAKPKPTSANCRPVLFGWQAIPEDARELTICEGEIDALSLWDMGFPALSVPFGGGSGAKQAWIEHEFHNLDRFETIYLCLDNDDVGREATAAILERLGRHRCKVVELPAKDANECLSQGLDVEEAFAHASLEDPEELVSAAEFCQQVEELFRPRDQDAIGYTVPWDGLRDQLRFRDSELSLWTGASGAGKSQVLSHALVDMMDQGAKCCLASLEMVPRQTLKRMVKQLGNVDVPTPDFLERCMGWLDGRLWIYNFVGRASINTLLDGFEYARKRYGIDVFVIDSFMRLGIGVDDYKAQDNAIFRLTDWAVSRPVHLHLVAHARKAGDSRDVPGTEDVKGTSEIGSNAFNIISVWRNRDLEEKIDRARIAGDPELAELESIPGVTLNVSKQRNGDFEGKKSVYFDRETYRYHNGDRINAKRYLE